MFTIDQAADFAGVSVNQIRCWLIARKLDAYDLGGGRVRIDEAELVDFLSSQSKRP
jgi:excisionase family DNA binding protein